MAVRVKVRLFASLREVAGPDVPLELPPGATAEEAWGRLAADFPALAPRRASVAVAVNRSYAAFDTVLREADELALLPPVSGG